MLFNWLIFLFYISKHRGVCVEVIYVKTYLNGSKIRVKSLAQDMPRSYITTIGLYSYLTFQITEWRNVFRKRMNQADNDISTKMIDSLLNFETVKYFNNEAYEFNRLDKSLEDYELAANQSRHSLSLLNIAQTFIIMLGITIMLVMSAFGIKNGDIDVGGFVVINAYMLQLYQPLNFLGSVYREIRQALTDMENMFSLLEVSQVSKDDLEDMPQSNVAEIRFDKVSFDYDIRRTIIKNISFTVPNGKKVAIVGPTGAGKSTISRLLFKFYCNIWSNKLFLGIYNFINYFYE